MACNLNKNVWLILLAVFVVVVFLREEPEARPNLQILSKLQ